MKRSQRLATLLKLVAMAEKNSRRALGEASHRTKECHDQLEMLSRYQREYSEQWLNRGQSGITGSDLRLLDGFRKQLDGTVTTQNHQLALAEQQKAQAAARWQQTRLRETSLLGLYESQLAREELESEKRVQREMDERSVVSVDPLTEIF